VVLVKAIIQKDWMDEEFGSPIKTLESIPYGKGKIFLVSLLSSALGVIAVFFTQHLFWYCCSLILVVLFNTSMFLTFWGVQDNHEPEPIRSQEYQTAYDRKLAELKAEYDFNVKHRKTEIPRRLGL
jgi:hypothetical protein